MPHVFSNHNSESHSKKLILGILISGSGSNMINLVEFVKTQNHPQLQVGCVISDQKEAPGIAKAKALGIPSTYLHPGEFKTKLVGEAENSYIKHLKSYGVNLVCLAGFMRVIKSKFISAFPDRIINIHPSLLPAYPGLNTHERVIAAKEKVTGCTVHLVDSGVDTGKILRQKTVPIQNNDTPLTLARRVIVAEHEIYRQVIEDFFKATLKS